ncbi:hypothetical protein F2Q70_00012932 [Brassica cretica]|uniref:Uncharacterized protein n=1 Tax=Brassica cretica TaxID=69181 RepID=A0A8S9MB93_BRACR|nr:hypothetical protein F2Q70_00012932 [Brassica cretica]
MEEGIEMSLVTYSFIVGGFSKAGNAESKVLVVSDVDSEEDDDGEDNDDDVNLVSGFLSSKFLDQVSDVDSEEDDDGEDNDDDVNLVSGFLSSK